MQQNTDTAIWVQFFKDASIPSQFAQSYANKFVENRIRFDLLGDIDKPLLNEMGITAIGDCLCILKHAKLINSQVEEKNKNEQNSTNNIATNDTNSKKRSDVAKRIIETYLSDPDAKPLNDKSTTLSADLISRLNFNPTKITFINEDSLNQLSSSSSSSPKVIVSSTTSDDDLRNKFKFKRKLDDSEPSLETLTKTIKLNQPKGPALEYRGLLKNETVAEPISKIVSLNPKRTKIVSSSLNERLRQTTRTSLSPTLTSSSGFKFENFKIEAKNDAATVVTKTPLASRLKSVNIRGSLKSDSIATTSVKKVTEQSASFKSNTPNEIIKSNKTEIIPITFDTKSSSKSVKITKNVATNNQQMNKRSTNKSIFDRISF